MVICIILSSLALTAAVVCAVVTVQERKRSRQRNAGQLKALGQAWEGALRKVQGRIDDLEHGAVPDYEKAKAAAKAVDDFHDGLANILNYDPYETVRRDRDSRGDGT